MRGRPVTVLPVASANAQHDMEVGCPNGKVALRATPAPPRPGSSLQTDCAAEPARHNPTRRWTLPSWPKPCEGSWASSRRRSRSPATHGILLR